MRAAGTPRAVIEKLNREIVATLQEPAIAERMAKAGLEPVGDVYVDSDRTVTDLPDGGPGHFLWGRVVAVAGGAAAAASTVAGVATALLRGRRRPA